MRDGFVQGWRQTGDFTDKQNIQLRSTFIASTLVHDVLLLAQLQFP